MTRGIYFLINKKTKKAYIGSSKNAPGRLDSHTLSLAAGTHYNANLQKDFDRHGYKAFKTKIFPRALPLAQLREIEGRCIRIAGDRAYNYVLTPRSRIAEKQRDMVSRTFYMPRECLNWLAEKAAADKRTTGNYLTHFIRQAMEQNK